MMSVNCLFRCCQGCVKILTESKNEGKTKMSKKETAKRYVLFIISLFFSALGVAFTKHGELGVSPISSVANVLSCTKGGFSLGVWLIIWNCILILGQILILRKKFQLIQLLQIPLSFLFGYFTDFGRKLHNASCNGDCRNSDTGLRRITVGFGKCYNELGRGFCKGNSRYGEQEFR